MKPRATEKMHERIRRLRKEARLTQEEIASSLHINRMAVVSMESGSRKVSADELMALCDALHCSADEILYGKRQDDPVLLTYNALNSRDRKEVLELMEFKLQRRKRAPG